MGHPRIGSLLIGWNENLWSFSVPDLSLQMWICIVPLGIFASTNIVTKCLSEIGRSSEFWCNCLSSRSPAAGHPGLVRSVQGRLLPSERRLRVGPDRQRQDPRVRPSHRKRFEGTTRHKDPRTRRPPRPRAGEAGLRRVQAVRRRHGPQGFPASGADSVPARAAPVG